MKTLILILLSGTALAQNQVWVTIPNAYSINAPTGSTFRYGTYATTFLISTGAHKIGDPAPEVWSAPITITASGAFLVADKFPADPSYGTSKEVDILETSSPQTITNTPNFGAGSVVATLSIPAGAAAAPPPPTTNSCSTDNTSCSRGTQSNAAFIITPAGQADLSPQETDSLKAALAEVDRTRAAAVLAEQNLQTIQKTIAATHGAPAAGPYQINTDFATALEQVPPQ